MSPYGIYILSAGFITPAYALAGAALASIPIIIHLLNRRRFKTIRWAAMEYLLAALRKNRRRLRFEQWILLATRCSLLGLLGLALARPVGCEKNFMGVGKSAGLHVIVIDNGLPMAYEANRPNAKTHLDQAKLIAKKLLDNLDKAGGNEAVSIIVTSGLEPKDPKRPLKATALFGKPTYDMDAARAALDRLDQSFGASDTPGALQMAIDTAEQAEKQPRKSLYILSSATHADWSSDTAKGEALKRIGPALTKQFPKPMFFNLGKPEQWNLAVMDLEPSSNLVTTRFPVDLLSTMKAFGPGASSTLQWQLDDRATERGGGSVRLDDKSPARQINTVQVAEGGYHVVTATLQNDEGLKADNTRWRALEVTSELKVLIVEGERKPTALDNPGTFLAMALAPASQGESSDTMVRKKTDYIAVDLITDESMPNKILGDYRAIILANVGQIPAAEGDRLAKYVREGGTLMVFMGSQVERFKATSYNDVLLPRGLMPGRLVSLMEDRGSEQKGFEFDFNPRGNMHPLLRVFSGVDNSGLTTARVFNYYQCLLPPQSSAETVLAYKGGKDPAITLHNLEKGRVLFFSTSANGEWTTLQVKPAFLALMHEMVAGTVNIGDRWMNLEVGQMLEIPPRLRLKNPTLTDPSRKDVPMEAMATADGFVLYRSKPLVKPGVYRLKDSGMTYPIAVNVPADEADIRLLKDAQLKKSLGDIELTMQPDAVPTEVLAVDDSNDFSWAMMVLVLALAGAECLMAMHFGHYRRAGGVVQPTASAVAAKAA